MSKKEHKEERFVRIATDRVDRILKLLRLLGNCARKANYDYTEEQVDKIFSALSEGLEQARLRFVDGGTARFSLAAPLEQSAPQGNSGSLLLLVTFLEVDCSPTLIQAPLNSSWERAAMIDQFDALLRESNQNEEGDETDRLTKLDRVVAATTEWLGVTPLVRDIDFSGEIV